MTRRSRALTNQLNIFAPETSRAAIQRVDFCGLPGQNCKRSDPLATCKRKFSPRIFTYSFSIVFVCSYSLDFHSSPPRYIYSYHRIRIFHFFSLIRLALKNCHKPKFGDGLRASSAQARYTALAKDPIGPGLRPSLFSLNRSSDLATSITNSIDLNSLKLAFSSRCNYSRIRHSEIR